MADPFASFFFPNASNSGGTVNQELRQRIALAMLMKQSKYPKTLGEGLSSIGEDVSNAFLTKALEQQDLEAQAQGRKAFPDTAAGALTKSAYADSQEEPASPSRAIVPAVQPVTPTITQPLLPARALPPDEQQSDEPGAPVRMPTAAAVQDWRNGTPRPNIPPVPQQPPPAPLTQPLTPPPQPQAATPPVAPATPFQNRFSGGPQAAVQPPPGTPVMAAGDEPSAQERDQGRNMLAQAMQAQQRGVQPQAALPPQPQPQAAVPPQPQAITPAPPQPQVRPVPQVRPAPSPQGTGGPGSPGYVPAELQPLPPKRILPVHPDALDAQRKMMENPGNQYVKQRGEMIINRLEADRQRQQAAIDEDYKAAQTQQRELVKQREDALITQPKRYMETAAPPPQVSSDPRLLGTPQSPQRTGPRIEPVPAGDIPERWVKQEGERLGKAKDSYEKAKPELTETVDIINKIRAHPAKPYATGMFSGITAATPSGKGFAALNEQLMGKNLVDAYDKLRGTGQIGEKEGQNFAKARARLTTAATQADYDEALQDLETTVRGTLERAQRNLKMPVTAWQNTQNDDYAPDLGEVKKGHEYLGGNPADPRNWKAVRR